MRIILVLSMFLLVACNMEVDVQINGEKNEELAQSWMDHLLISGDLDAASELMHEDFTFMWMGIVYPGSEIHGKESFFDNYWPVVGELLPNGIVLTTIDAISDNDGVDLILGVSLSVDVIISDDSLLIAPWLSLIFSNSLILKTSSSIFF